MMKRLLVVAGMIFLITASSAPALVGDPLPELTSPSEGAAVDASYSSVILYYTCPVFTWFSAAHGYVGGGSSRYFTEVSTTAARDSAGGLVSAFERSPATAVSSGCASAVSSNLLTPGATYYWAAYRSINDEETGYEASASVRSFTVAIPASPSPSPTSTPAATTTTGTTTSTIAPTTTSTTSAPSASISAIGSGKWSRKTRKLSFKLTGNGNVRYTAYIKYKGKRLSFPKWTVPLKPNASTAVKLEPTAKIRSALRHLKKVTVTVTATVPGASRQLKIVIRP